MGTTSRDASFADFSLISNSIVDRLAYHARAGKRIPTQSYAISLLNLAPLVF
jgi:hypothetical protein